MRTSHRLLFSTYITSVVAMGFGLLTYSGYRMASGGVGFEWIILALLAMLGGSLALKIPGICSRVSSSDIFVFTNSILFGPCAGAVTAALDGLMGSMRSDSGSRRMECTLFNMSAMALSAYTAGTVFVAVRETTMGLSGGLLLPAGLMAVVYYVSNSIYVATIIALDQGKNVYQIWSENFLWTAMSFVTAAAVAAQIATQGHRITPWLVLAVLTVLAITQWSHKTYLATLAERIREQNRNAMCVKVVEILAAAIGAKDQYEPGHVRRMQIYAQRLARATGMSSEGELRGVETAAMLHDVGKLGVSEQILNKPGRLTESEYEQVKMHSKIGADLFESVGFDSPVKDYVRHHHERWDGTGYPDGLRGEEIPLGARVLAVVGTYEALTSHRPYQEKYSSDEALGILRSMAGRHYDPAVVEKFAEILPDIPAEVQKIGASGDLAEGLAAILGSARLAGYKLENSPVT